MARQRRGSFAVGDWLVEPELNRISWESQTTVLRPQVMELLVYLAEQKGRVVSADELLDNLWAGKIVSGSTVYNCVAELRHALANGETAKPYVETVPKKGYRLLAPVSGLGVAQDNARKQPVLGASKRRRAAAIGVTAVCIVVALALLFIYSPSPEWPRLTSDDGGLASDRIVLPLRLPHFADPKFTTAQTTLALSPDGRQIAYTGFDGSDVHLYLKDAESAEPRKLAGTEGAEIPFFSPNGGWVGFFARGRLKRTPTSGGQPVEIAPLPGVPLGASWGDDDKIVFDIGFRSNLQRISSAGGMIESVTELRDEEIDHRNPHVLPRADAILYQVGTQNSVIQTKPAEIWVLDQRSGERRFLIAGAYPKYAKGRLLFLKPDSTGRSLWSVGFELDTLTVTGNPAPVSTDEFTENFAVSRSGALLYAQPRQVLRSVLRVQDAHGSRVLVSSDKTISHPRFSPDSRSLAVSIGFKTEADVWIFDLVGDRKPTRLTSDHGTCPVWSPDADQIAYAKSTVGILRQAVKSSAAPKIVKSNDGFAFPIQWTVDGLLYAQINPGTHGDIYFQPSKNPRISIDADEAVSITGQISPNGRWIAYSRMDSAGPEVFVKRFPDGHRRWRVSTGRADNPKWSPDGATLYYEAIDRIMSVSVSEEEVITIGTPVPVVEFSGRPNITLDPYDVSSDGQAFAIIDTVYGDPPTPVYIGNWQQPMN